uniref:Uncharacterized protein n=1 Tax=Anguilla anguilla TaxID=7936 RepID=A0A0E9XGE7_ANGAN
MCSTSNSLNFKFYMWLGIHILCSMHECIFEKHLNHYDPNH